VTTVVDDLVAAAQKGCGDEELRALLKRLVPDYEPSAAGVPVADREAVVGVAEQATGDA
jgi:hypothetical protein